MKKSKDNLLLILCVIILLILILLINILKPRTNEVCFENNCFKVELAITEEQQYKGLANRTSLDSNKGMLFVFQEEEYSPFWMKGMFFPLDIIWIGKDSTVVDIARSVDTCIICFGIYPEANATYVLELNANTTARINLNVGDKVDIKLLPEWTKIL